IDEPYVLHTGGVSKDRGFDVMIGAAERMRAMGVSAPIVNLGPIYLGNYAKADQDALLARAQAADVRCVGLVPYAQSLRWIAHARVGYLPMVLSENNIRGQPRKMFEYFAFGLPVVACDFGRVKEIIERHDAGLLVDTDDPSSHADALVRLLRDGSAHERYARNARAAGQTYSFDAELPKLMSLYDVALAGKFAPLTETR
ncbi:MAG TPA: glycosyltransferase, partial [Candidatus Eremiobacteraceae bacterium]|nr:glycosyltransferase [Candidatus Eremiobacteraceae bacterium]